MMTSKGAVTPTRVLIVDDDQTVRWLIGAFLDFEAAFEVVGEAENSSEALQKAAELKPDLVTMDFNMPGPDGDECIREMKSRWPGMHILALTSSGTDATRRMIEAGAYAAIDKAHMELVVPALMQIRDQRESDGLGGAADDAETEVASEWEQLREVIAEMDAGAARTLHDHKGKLTERLELLVVLKAISVALRNPKYTTEQANEAASRLVWAVLDGP